MAAPPVGTSCPAASSGAVPATPAGSAAAAGLVSGPRRAGAGYSGGRGCGSPSGAVLDPWCWCRCSNLRYSLKQAAAVGSLLAHTARLDLEITLVSPLRDCSNLCFTSFRFHSLFNCFQLLLRRICFNTQMSALTCTHLQTHWWGKRVRAVAGRGVLPRHRAR